MSTVADSSHKAPPRGITIPSCPAILSALMTELRQPMISDKRVAQLIGADVGLAAAVIKSANSPLFGARREIGSIADAVRLLGFTRLTQLVHEGLLRTALGGRDPALEQFWASSAHTAAVSAELARKLGGVNADTAYTFGLFHDCGIPLLMQRFPAYVEILQRARQAAAQALTAIEDAALNTNHAAVGHLLTRAWGLPETICAAILLHHDFDALQDGPGLDGEARTLIALNAIAEHIVDQFLHTNQSTEWLEWPRAQGRVMAYLGLSATETEDLVEDLLYQLDRQSNAVRA